MDMSDLRKEYTSKSLSRSELSESPFTQFLLWFQDALDADITEPNSMQIATSSTDGLPSCRTVLMKLFDEQGLIFYSNYESRKAKELLKNPHAAVAFYWRELERQVLIEGEVERVSAKESDAYFARRPRKSQLAVWASKQDFEISSRNVLENRLHEIELKFERKDVPRPPYWGGYRLIPDRFEFWQGGKNRLHDRFGYLWQKKSWAIHRLSP